MNGPTTAAEELARRLLATEARETASPLDYAVLRAIEKLRFYLTRFVGAAGFQSLLARTLALTKAQRAWLESVQVTTEGTLAGFEVAAQRRDVDEVRNGERALLAQLLELLVLFIGETMTLQIVRDVWSEAGTDALNFSTEETTG